MQKHNDPTGSLLRRWLPKKKKLVLLLLPCCESVVVEEGVDVPRDARRDVEGGPKEKGGQQG